MKARLWINALTLSLLISTPVYAAEDTATKVKQHIEQHQAAQVVKPSLQGSLSTSYYTQGANDKKLPSKDQKMSLASRLSFDLKKEKQWASFGWSLGGGAGLNESPATIRLSKAFMGCRLLQIKGSHLDLEIGRKPGAVPSVMQTGSSKDGAILSVSHPIEKVAQFNGSIVAFLSNSFIDGKKGVFLDKKEAGSEKLLGTHFATHASLSKIGGSDLEVEYSLTSWLPVFFSKKTMQSMNKVSLIEKSQKHSYLNSECSLGWSASPEGLGKKVSLSSTLLFNHLNSSLIEKGDLTGKSEPKQQRGVGSALSLSIGDEMKRVGDWNAELSYQRLTPHTIPADDDGSMGLGYTSKELASDKVNDSFSGMEATLRYLLQEGMEISASFTRSAALKQDKEGCRRVFRSFRLSATHKF